jgi:hypothetical protein
MSIVNLGRLLALKQQMLASVAASPKEAKRTVKAERKATKVARTKAAKAAKVIAQVKESVTAMGWTPPVSFNQWLKWNKVDVNVVDADKRSVSDWARVGWNYPATLGTSVLLAQSTVHAEYRGYVNARFAEPMRFNGTNGNAFDKIVKREEWLEKQGKHDLGLLGYSAIDRVQIAVYYAWVKRVTRWLEQTGADKAYATEMGQALRDLRSDAELREAAELDGRSRYVVSGVTADEFPRIRKQSQLEAVTIAARRLELRAEFATLPMAGWSNEDGTEQKPYGSAWVPSVGDVYQALFAVTKEGLRKFRNTLEGLTQDGMISDAAQFIAGHRHDLAEAGLDRAVARLDKSLERLSAEDEALGMFDFDIVNVERQIIVKVTQDSSVWQPKTNAEALAAVALQGLVDGVSLSDLREAFSELSERAFTQLFRDAEIISSDIKDMAVFVTTRHTLMEQAATEAFTA